MADGADTRVNLAALKRVDPYTVEIVETGTQVAIYKFNSQSNEWVRWPPAHMLHERFVSRFRRERRRSIRFGEEWNSTYSVLINLSAGKNLYRRHPFPLRSVSSQMVPQWIQTPLIRPLTAANSVYKLLLTLACPVTQLPSPHLSTHFNSQEHILSQASIAGDHHSEKFWPNNFRN